MYHNDRMKTGGGVALRIFARMYEKEKKNRKNLKIKNFERTKQYKKIVWRYGGEGYTHKVWPGTMQRFSEKSEFTEG